MIEENDSSSGGGIFLREAARLRLRHVYVRRNGAARGASALEAHSTRSRASAVEMLGGGLSGGRPTIVLLSASGAEPRPTFRAKDAALAAEVRAMRGFEDAGGCRFV